MSSCSQKFTSCDCQNCKNNVKNCQNREKLSNFPKMVKIMSTIVKIVKSCQHCKQFKNCQQMTKLPTCWSSHVSSSLWSNVSKVTVSRVTLCMSKVKVPWDSGPEPVSEWQVHLLSCSGQLQRRDKAKPPFSRRWPADDPLNPVPMLKATTLYILLQPLIITACKLKGHVVSVTSWSHRIVHRNWSLPKSMSC